MTLLQVVVNMLAVVMEIKKKYIKTCTSRNTRCVALTGAHTVHPIAMKHSQVVNIAMVLEI